MEVSTWFVIADFTLGAAVGALMVSLQRECAIERIRRDFEQQLTGLIERRSTSGQNRECSGTTGQDLSTFITSAEQVPKDELSWISSAFPPPADSAGTRANQ